MPVASQFDRLLIERVRRGNSEAWSELIDRFEGRLLAFVASRIKGNTASEDVVQETFVGFLTSLPNYDGDRPLESYLFSIAAHKLTDHLRREGRRPTIPLIPDKASGNSWEVPGPARGASSIVQSGERRQIEEQVLVQALQEQIDRWRQRGEWDKLRCAELLFVRGMPNKEVALLLELSEQTVANYKFECLARLKSTLRKQGLSQDLFPELAAHDE